MPLRWQCPEAIVTRTYTAKSDVFSFHVCLWEIYAEGAMPYAGMTSEAAFQAVKVGHRLSRPSVSTPDAIVTLIPSMTDAWCSTCGTLGRSPWLPQVLLLFVQHLRTR